MDKKLIINRTNTLITLNKIKIKPKSSVEITNSEYQKLLQTSNIFHKYLDSNFIVCTPIQTKLNVNTKQTIINNSDTTNNSINIVNTKANNAIENQATNIDITDNFNSNSNEENVVKSTNTNKKTNKRGRKTRLVEADENKVNKE